MFTRLVKKFGDDSRALDWGSAESQQLRFSVLAQVGDLEGARVLDVGCGLGHFVDWLQSKKIQTRYTGIDITPRMIESSRHRFPALDFRVMNLLEEKSSEKYDYVVSSGIFALRQKSAFEYLQAMVKRMFESCTRGVAFNSLSSWAEHRDPGEFHADPVKVLAFCRKLTPKVVLRHDYHPRDFTMYLYRSSERVHES
ncbi:MAG: class I SAM-dependent methyltransferase [Acidobacteriia bacterium]|nr:class I SAM-dependent methyltransferase [Terriglobia bacterium]